MARAQSPEEAEQELMQLVGFSIGEQLFGVDILMVQEIIRSAPITPVPSSPEFVEGVINLRGKILPVIDLRKRLNLMVDEPRPEKTWVLILDIQGKITGFIVDAVSKVLKVDGATIEPAPDIITAGLQSQYLQGVCEINEKLLVILDFQRVLLQEELQQLQDLNELEE